MIVVVVAVVLAILVMKIKVLLQNNFPQFINYADHCWKLNSHLYTIVVCCSTYHFLFGYYPRFSKCTLFIDWTVLWYFSCLSPYIFSYSNLQHEEITNRGYYKNDKFSHTICFLLNLTNVNMHVFLMYFTFNFKCCFSYITTERKIKPGPRGGYQCLLCEVPR